MSPNVPDLSDWEIRQAKGQCGWEGCPLDAAPGCAYCAKHDAATKARGRAWVAGRRKALRAKRLCVVCKRKSKTFRCRSCERGNRRRVDKPKIGVDKRGQIVIEERTDGRQPTERYVGRSRKGAPSTADMLRDLLIDARDARDKFERYVGNIEKAIREGVDALGRVDRMALLRVYAEPGARACRMLAAGVLRLDPEADVLPSEDE